MWHVTVKKISKLQSVGAETMAPGDLNLKKSWNPKLMKNQKVVWEREQEALAERKKIQERQKEIEEEREKAELRRLRHGSKGKAERERIEWMYEHEKEDEKDEEEDDDEDEDDDFLLGNKRLDEVLLKDTKRAGPEDKLTSTLQVGSKSMGLLSQKEQQKIVADDPMAKMLALSKNRQTVPRADKRVGQNGRVQKFGRASNQSTYKSSYRRANSKATSGFS